MTTAKMIYLACRNPVIAAENFPDAWRSHARLAARIPYAFGASAATMLVTVAYSYPRLA